jgi:putative oxidoreductase
MNGFFARLDGLGHFLLRVVAGSMFFCHGLPKILGVLSDKPTQPPGSQLWIGGVIELMCGALITLGLVTRFAAFLASGTMAVAYFQFHFKGNWADHNWLPMINKGELALLYAVVFLFLCARGAGPLSIDRKLGWD